MTQKAFDLTLPGVILLTLKSTAKDLAVVHVHFVRQKGENEPEYFKDIDQKLAEGKNHIIKLGESIPIPGVLIKLRGVVDVKDEPPKGESPNGYYPPGSEKPLHLMTEEEKGDAGLGREEPVSKGD